MSENLARQFELLPQYFGWHVVISAIALGAGLLISLPLGVLAARRPRMGTGVLAIASIVQTIPSIALLALTYALLVAIKDSLGTEQFRALGFWPTIIALTMYSILPMLRNTVTGLRGIDPTMIEAARGLGMTDRQRLVKVELPLAMPVIIAGVRTSTVWTIGIATLSTPIGQTSLGNYIFGGLQTFNIPAVVFGCVAAALLAIVADLLIAGLEKAVTARAAPGSVASCVALLLVVAMGVVGVTRGQTSGRGDSIVVGAKNFNEQFVLASLIDRRLSDAGYNTRRVEGLGSLNAFNALVAGEIDVYVDYSGTIWTNAMPPEMKSTDPSRATVLHGVTEWLRDEHGVTNLGSLGFENTYALAMRRDETAASLDDLAPKSPQLIIGGSVEFFERPEWAKLQATYPLSFAECVPMNPTLMYEAIAAREVDVIVAFSSDGRIAAYDLATVADPRGAFPPYDAVVLVSRRAAEDDKLLDALRPLIGAVDVELMREANQLVDVEKRSPDDAARWLDEQLEAR